MKQLIQCGAKVNAVTADKNTALHIATHGGNVNVVKLFLENRANVNAKGFHFGRSLQLAAMEMIFRFSGDGKLVHATGPPQAKIWKIVRAFATNCT